MQHPDAVYIASYQPDGSSFLTVCNDYVVRIWDAQTRQLTGQPLLHTSRINSARFSADGKRILTANEDKSARIWDAETGQPIGPPLLHDKSLNTASFSPDGSQMVSASDDQTAKIWDISSLELLDGTLAEAITTTESGERLGRQLGMLEQVPTEKRQLMVQALEQGLANHPDWTTLVQQDLYPQPNLPISTKWTITRRDTATSLIRNGTAESIRSVLLIDPGHPLLQIALASLNDYARQADFLREFGVKRLPDDAAICREAAELLIQQNDRRRAMRIVEKTIQLDPDNPETIRLKKLLANE